MRTFRRELFQRLELTIIGVTPNTCGDCNACCRSLGVKEIGKPYNTPCVHQCAQGCGIYATKPESCSAWGCLWLMGVIDGPRPNESGFILEASTLYTDYDQAAIRVYLTRPDREVDMEALKQALDQAQAYTTDAKYGVPVAICYHDSHVGMGPGVINCDLYPYRADREAEYPLVKKVEEAKTGILVGEQVVGDPITNP